MGKLQRITGKVFGETASATGDADIGPYIGQFGSAKLGTYYGTADISEIQNLTAWSNGFIDAVTPSNQYPTLPEMTGVCKNLSHQECYILQQGIPEYDANTEYYTNGFCSYGNEIYISLQDSNTGNQPDTSPTYWKKYSSNFANTDLSNLTATGENHFANKDLSNLTSTGQKVLDGQWVASGLTIVTERNSQTTNDLEYSLSTYLPSDNYKYEVMFSMIGSTATALGSTQRGLLSTDIYSSQWRVYIAENPVQGRNFQAGGSAILPVGTNRRVIVRAHPSNTGTFNLYALGYRRIGTNS